MKQFVLLVLILISMCAVSVAQPDAPRPPAAASPVSYGLVIDNSGSFRLLLDRVMSVSTEIIDQHRPDDEAFLVTFVSTDKIVLRQELTDSKTDLRDAAENMFIEGGQTAILDAMKSAADYLATNAKPDTTRSLVLVTDGDDRNSRTKFDDLLKLLKEQKIRVFVIALSDLKVITRLIDRLAKETGGKMFLPKTRADLTAIASEASMLLRAK